MLVMIVSSVCVVYMFDVVFLWWMCCLCVCSVRCSVGLFCVLIVMLMRWFGIWCLNLLCMVM